MPIAVCGLLSAHPGYDCSDWSGIEVASIDILRIEKMDGAIVKYIPTAHALTEGDQVSR